MQTAIHRTDNNNDVSSLKREGNGGAVLIIVMWIAFGLVTVTLYFGHSMNFEYRGARQTSAGYQSEQAISGALRYFQFILSEMEESGMHPDPNEYNSQYFNIGDSTVFLLGRTGEEPITSTEPVFGIIDETGKININLAPYDILVNLPTITPEFAAAIIDWRDEDDDVTENGAEASAYALNSPAYEIKNARFETLEELRMVYGATTEMLYGEDVNQNGVLDPNENDGALSPPMDNGDGVLDFGIIEHLTVYAEVPEENGEDEVPSNGASDDNSPEAARLQQQSGQDQDLTLKININSASATVLSTLPGMNTSLAQQVVSARIANQDPNADMDWLDGALEPEIIAGIQDFITTQTFFFTLDVAAVGQNGHGYRRTRFVIDNSSEEPTVLHKRNMGRYGWALGETIRQQFSASSNNSNSIF